MTIRDGSWKAAKKSGEKKYVSSAGCVACAKAAVRKKRELPDPPEAA